MAAPVIKRRRLHELSIRETSGVDHPANRSQLAGAEGWLVLKSDSTPATAEDMIRAFPSRAEEIARAELEDILERAREVSTAAHARQAAKATAAPVAPRSTPATPPVPKAKEAPMTPPTKTAVMEVIRSAASDYRTSAGCALTQEQAIGKVLELQPALAKAYRDAPIGPAAVERADHAIVDPAHHHIAALDAHVEKLAKARGTSKAEAYTNLDAHGLRLKCVVKQKQGHHGEAVEAKAAAERASGA